MGYTIQGRVRSVTFSRNDYYIFSLDPKVTCKGSLLGITSLVPGMSLSVEGRWVRHPKFGQQLEVTSWSPWAPTEADVEFFLTFCLGVSSVRAGDIVDMFGMETFEVLSKEPNKLLAVPDIDQVALDLLVEAWQKIISCVELASFLSDYDVTPDQVRSIYATFGPDAKLLVGENPYCLVEVAGFPFVKADDIARSLGVGPEDPRRYEGAVLWALHEVMSSGHLCVRSGNVASVLRTLIAGSPIDPFDLWSFSDRILGAVSRLEEAGKVKVDPAVGVYLPSNFWFERESARLLAKFIGSASFDLDAEEFLSSYESTFQIKLAESQKQAIHKLIDHKVLALTGLPGTGKTTVVKAIVSLFEKAGVKYSLMAPTGIAAKRLASVTGREAATIHRTFGYDGENWKYSRACTYNIGAVVIDEASMVDQALLFRVLDALDPSTVLVLVGDDAQLPSVGPGNVLRELIKCSDVPTVRLTEIFRQGMQSSIVLNAHRVNRGEDIDSGTVSSDFSFISLSNETKAADLIVRLAGKLKEGDANFQVLAPKYDGVLGVTNLNNLIREVLNPISPGKREVTLEGQLYRDGDRVMVTRNDYELSVYNGDMGKIMSIERDHLVVRVHGAGEGGVDLIVEFPKLEVPQKLRLAYAITVHKSQGSEFDTVILPIVRAHGRMLQRNLFYTAITRAKKKVWVIGDRGAVGKAIENDKVVQRGTAFGYAISKALAEKDEHEAGDDQEDLRENQSATH